MAEVFASCASDDLAVSLPIIEKLRHAGVSVWMKGEEDPTEYRSVAKAIDDCKVVILLCSRSPLNSRDLARDARTAYDFEKPHILLWLERVTKAERVRYWQSSMEMTEFRIFALKELDVSAESHEAWWPRLLQTLQLAGISTIRRGAYLAGRASLADTGITKWEKVYIFISSTFNDMHAERDYLVKQVFPRLSEWCERRKLHMVDIDLRWGLTEADATQNRNVVNVCLNRIDECRPFFLCLLGQRYGWIPARDDISEDTMNHYPGLEAAVGRGASVTELEILHSVISPFHGVETIEEKGFRRAEYPFFYLRDDSYLDSLPDEPPNLKRIYTDTEEMDEERRALLRTKREELIRRIEDAGRPLHVYSAEWLESGTTPEIALSLQCPASLEENQLRWRDSWRELAGVEVSGLDVEEDPAETAKAKSFNRQLTRGRLGNFQSASREFGDVILDDLTEAIERRFPDHRESEDRDELQREIDQQEQFILVSSDGFIRREGDFDELDEYLNGESNQLFALTAGAGTGKSTLLANWVSHWRRETAADPDRFIHFRFVGASDGSTVVHSLLYSLLKEIKRTSGRIYDDIPTGHRALRAVFPELLEIVGLDSKTMIIIDALNQLESGLADLDWLPRQLPAGVKLVVSFARDGEEAEELYRDLASDERVLLKELRPFTERRDRRQMVEAYLSRYLKELDERYIETMIDSPAAHNPLYLKVVLSELRVFGSFENLGKKIKTDFGDSPLSAFLGVLNRMETDPAYSPIDPGEAVPLIFGLLAHARQGLSIDELTWLLVHARGLDQTDDHRRIAAHAAHLFLRQMRPFLSRRSGRYDFFYESFKHAALERYVSEEDDAPGRTAPGWHRLLADHFFALPLQNGPHAEGLIRRKVSALPHHLIRAHDWERLEHTLTDLAFIAAKCSEQMVYELMKDYEEALHVLPEAQDDRREETKLEGQVAKYVDDLVTCARGEIESPGIIPSLEPWSDQRIEEDSERIRTAPTRMDRIRAHHQFVSSESHGLASYKPGPGHCLQQACNSARSGPVAEVANETVADESSDVLLLVHPAQRPDFNPHPALLRTLVDQDVGLTCAAITPDGRLAIWGGNYSSSLWDTMSGERLKVLEANSCHCVDITPDGKRAFSADENRVNTVWDLRSGESLSSFVSEVSLLDVSMIPDGKRAVSGDYDGVVRLWDLERGECLRELPGHDRLVTSVAVAANGNQAISASEDRTLRLWDLQTGECLRVLAGHTDFVWCVSVTPDMASAISASADRTLRLWDTRSGECIWTLSRAKGQSFRRVDITPDGRRAVSGSWDGWLQLWDLESRRLIRDIRAHSWDSTCLCLTVDGRRAVSGGDESALRVWDLEKGACSEPLPRLGRHVVLSPFGDRAVSAGGSRVHLLDTESGICQWSQEKPAKGSPKEGLNTYDSIAEVQITPSTPCGESAVSRDKKGNGLLVWDLEDEAGVPEALEGHEGAVTCMAMTPDGKRVVSGSEDRTLRIWDVEDKIMVEVLERYAGEVERGVVLTHAGEVERVLLTSDGRIAISGDRGGTTRTWDLETGEHLQSFEGHLCQIFPDGRGLILNRDGFLTVSHIDTGQCLRTFEDIINFESLAVSPDGKLAVGSSGASSPAVWSLREGGPVRGLHGHSGRVTCLSITPDGKRAISGSEDRSLRVWNLDDGDCVASYQTPGEVISISEIQAGGLLLFGTSDWRTIQTEARNLLQAEPVATAMRQWLYGDVDDDGRWDDDIQTWCPWCNWLHPVEDEVLEVITSISLNARLSPGQSPCVALPEEAWDEPGLISRCPSCKSPLKFNPFLVDNRR